MGTPIDTMLPWTHVRSGPAHELVYLLWYGGIYPEIDRPIVHDVAHVVEKCRWLPLPVTVGTSFAPDTDYQRITTVVSTTGGDTLNYCDSKIHE